MYNPINITLPLFNAGALAGAYTPWAVNSGVPVAEPQRNGLVDRTLNELVMPDDGSGQRPVRRITRPNQIQQFTLSSGKTAFLICDASGVYQAELSGNSWYVSWYFDAEDYKRMMKVRLGIPLATPLDIGFQPSAAQRLPNGSYLITNAWIGARTRQQAGEVGIGDLMRGGSFVGEVFQVTGVRTFDPATGAPVDAGAFPLFDSFSSPKIVTAPGAKFEQKMGSVGNTNLLEHPLFGDRL